MGALALGLALLSCSQSAVWTSEVAVWRQAQAIAPTRPDVWVHGAMAVLDAPGDPRDAWRLLRAEAFLEQAEAVRPGQPAAEQRWATDAIAATTAVVRMRQGRLLEASILMQSPVEMSARRQLCAHFRSVCALAAS